MPTVMRRIGMATLAMIPAIQEKLCHILQCGQTRAALGICCEQARHSLVSVMASRDSAVQGECLSFRSAPLEMCADQNRAGTDED